MVYMPALPVGTVPELQPQPNNSLMPLWSACSFRTVWMARHRLIKIEARESAVHYAHIVELAFDPHRILTIRDMSRNARCIVASREFIDFYELALDFSDVRGHPHVGTVFMAFPVSRLVFFFGQVYFDNATGVIGIGGTLALLCADRRSLT